MTLLELVVAVTIAGLSLVGLFEAGSSGLFATDTAARLEEAVERAQSHLAAVGRASAITASDTRGDDGGGFRWRLRVQPIAAQRSTGNAAASAIATLYDVEVIISWQTRGHDRSIRLETRRLGVSATTP